MFGKCIKHELRATARTLIPYFIAILALGLFLGAVFAVGMRVDASTEVEIPSFFGAMVGLLFMALFGLAVAVEIVTFIMIIRRFYTSFFTDEGYLSLTLPVTVNEHIFSKFVVAVIWQVTVSVVVVVSIALTVLGIMIGFGDMGALLEISDSVGMIFAEAGAEFAEIFGGQFFVLALVSALISVVSQIFMLYFVISLACMLAKKHRVVVGVLCYYVINLVFSIISSIAGSIMFVITAVSENITDAVPSMAGFMNATMIFSILLTVAQGVLCYFGMLWILTKKLNLD